MMSHSETHGAGEGGTPSALRFNLVAGCGSLFREELEGKTEERKERLWEEPRGCEANLKAGAVDPVKNHGVLTRALGRDCREVAVGRGVPWVCDRLEVCGGRGRAYG